MTTFTNLFTPLTVRGRTIPNRIVSTPHATGWSCLAASSQTRKSTTTYARRLVGWDW